MTTAIRSSLQKEIFQKDDERLIAVAHIKPDNNKKKKEVFVCLVVSIEQPVVVRIHFVKAEKEDVFRKKQYFPLRDVRVVDGINPRKPISDFNMVINDKEYRLSTSTYEEKEAFIRQLYKLANSYLPVQKPDFINLTIPVEALAPQNIVSETIDDTCNEIQSDYQPISAKEEADFRRLLSKANLKIDKAKQFASVLNEQLMRLDGANIESIMGSEQHVTDLIELIDGALDEATSIEKQLDEYDAILSYVRDSVELIEEKDSLGYIERTNIKQLTHELSDFIYLMDTINKDHVNMLKNANLSDPTSINLCCQSARALNAFLMKKTDLSGMTAYQERIEELNRVTADFVDKLYSHITALFDMMGSMLDGQDWGELIMQKHSQRHHALLPYSDLMLWLKVARANVFQNVLNRYVTGAENLYKREFERYFQALCQRVSAEANKCNSSMNETVMEFATKLLNTAIEESRTLVESEEKFCIRFFHLNSELFSASFDTQSTGGSDSMSTKSLEKKMGDQVKSMIGPIFDSLPFYVQKYSAFCKSYHQLMVATMFVALTKGFSTSQESNSYYPVLYGSILVNLKRQFDDQMKIMESTFMNVKLNKKSRVGILDIISKFKQLVISSDRIFGASDRRNDLDKWHEKLADAVIAGINAAADSPNSKYPPTVVRLENFHELRNTLSELKIACLDSRKKMVRKLYQENVDAYVKEYMGKPLDKIHVFFEQIERQIRNGKKPEEIGYEQQFSRMELKKVISAYPAREVKKGLENLYKKVEKHLCPHSSLLVVVWRDMQGEFLKQIKHYQQLIAQCYPSPRVDLEFSIDDVLRFFEEIAQQH